MRLTGVAGHSAHAVLPWKPWFRVLSEGKLLSPRCSVEVESWISPPSKQQLSSRLASYRISLLLPVRPGAEVPSPPPAFQTHAFFTPCTMTCSNHLLPVGVFLGPHTTAQHPYRDTRANQTRLPLLILPGRSKCKFQGRVSN